ncbi:acylneuraminate cytidylyltransferase family protein [bacterium]|nr:acylneuraminate cytidylyltransferase family protein [bacterium]
MNIAFIPVRGGSKSIPLKNIKLLAGKPLVYWTAFAVENANCIDKLIIATDSKEIKDTVLGFGFKKLEVYDRKAENANDTASTESVMLEYIEQSDLKEDDYFFLIQATSPMLKSNHIDEMYKQFLDEKSDSAFSCVVSKRFYWNYDGEPVNYDYKNRPRRQDFAGYLLENGACYINSVKNIKQDKNRISGKKSMYIMPEYTSYEIDEPDDFIIIEKLMEKHN